MDKKKLDQVKSIQWIRAGDIADSTKKLVESNLSPDMFKQGAMNDSAMLAIFKILAKYP